MNGTIDWSSIVTICVCLSYEMTTGTVSEEVLEPLTLGNSYVPTFAGILAEYVTCSLPMVTSSVFHLSKSGAWILNS